MVFEILVHDPAESDWDEQPASTLTLSEWRELKPEWTPDFDEVGLRLVPTDGVPWERAGWAPLDLMERMAAEAAHRLSLGLPALLRSAQDDVASWILLEPDGDRVRLAVLRDMESPWATWFPVATPPRWTNPADAPARLYAYVDEQRARLLRSFDRPAAEHAHLRGRSIARGALIAALASAAATAGRVCRGE
jgi:hypothetical protein